MIRILDPLASIAVAVLLIVLVPVYLVGCLIVGALASIKGGSA